MHVWHKQFQPTMAFGWKPDDIFCIYSAVCEHSHFFLFFTP